MKNVTYGLASILLLIVSVFMTGCTNTNIQTNTQSLKVPAECEKLWDIDLGEDYSIGTAGTYFARWMDDDLDLELFVHRGNLSDADLTRSEKVIVDGIACYTNADAVNWDGTNESGEWIGGTNYTKTLTYAQNGLVCTLAGNAAKQEISLDIISLMTAQSLMDRNVSEYQQFRKTNENWTIGFQKGKISGSISIIPPPLDQAVYQEWSKSEDCSLVKEADLEYYLLKRDDQEDSPNNAAIAFLSSHGLIECRAGVPYSKRNEVPRDELNFINMEMVKRILEVVFAK